MVRIERRAHRTSRNGHMSRNRRADVPGSQRQLPDRRFVPEIGRGCAGLEAGVDLQKPSCRAKVGTATIADGEGQCYGRDEERYGQREHSGQLRSSGAPPWFGGAQFNRQASVTLGASSAQFSTSPSKLTGQRALCLSCREPSRGSSRFGAQTT